MKTIINIFGPPLLVEKISDQLPKDLFIVQQLGRNEIIDFTQKDKPKFEPIKIKGLDRYWEEVWHPTLKVSKDHFDRIVKTIVSNASLDRAKNLVWAEGLPLADLCRFVFDALDIPYRVIEWGPFADTFFMVKEGIFLREKFDIDYENKNYNEKKLDEFIKKELSHEVIKDRTDITVNIEKNDQFLNGKTPYVVFFAPFSKWIKSVNTDFKDLDDCLRFVVNEFKKSSLSSSHHLLVKLHPVDKVLDVSTSLKDSEKVHFVDPFFSAKELIKKAEFVIQSQSKIIFETLLFFKKIINLGSSAFEVPSVLYNVRPSEDLSGILEKVFSNEIDKSNVYKCLQYLHDDCLLHTDDSAEIRSKLSSDLCEGGKGDLSFLWSFKVATKYIEEKSVPYNDYDKVLKAYRKLEKENVSQRSDIEKSTKEFKEIIVGQIKSLEVFEKEEKKAVEAYKKLKGQYVAQHVEIESLQNKFKDELAEAQKAYKNAQKDLDETRKVYKNVQEDLGETRKAYKNVQEDLGETRKAYKIIRTKLSDLEEGQFGDDFKKVAIVVVQKMKLPIKKVESFVCDLETLGFEVVYINLSGEKYQFDDYLDINYVEISEESLQFNTIENIAQGMAERDLLVYVKLDSRSVNKIGEIVLDIKRTPHKSLVNFSVDMEDLFKIPVGQIENLQEQINVRDRLLVEKENLLSVLVNSWSWKASHPIRLFGKLVKIRKIRASRARFLSEFWPKVKSSYRKRGLIGTMKKVIRKVVYKDPFSPAMNVELEKYKAFIMRNLLSHRDIGKAFKNMKTWKYKPKISILMPVYNCPEIYLRKAINSVLDQIYDNFELVIVNDGSPHKICDYILQEYAARDSRIKYVNSKKNMGIVGASNLAFENATGEFVALFDHDDELTPEALYENVKLLQEFPKTDFIYSDHDKMDRNGRRFDPEFKPDWSPELFLSYGYTVHFRVFRKSVIDKLGTLFYDKYKSCQDYDLILRVSEITDKIKHIPKILYHWRSIPGSTAMDVAFKPEQQTNGQLAVQDHLERRNIKAVVEVPEFAEKLRLSLYNLKFSLPIKENPKVTILIPTKDGLNYLKPCIDSIIEKTDYTNYEIVVVNNNSEEKETFNYFKKNSDKFKVIDLPTDKFDFAYIHNKAMKNINTKYTLLLNNDVKVINKDWLTQMVGTFTISPDVGAVGAKLLYEDKTLQHAGVVLGIHTTADHAFRAQPENSIGYMFFPQVIRNYSACTAACLLVDTDLYKKVGGMDPKLAMAYNDVDLCLKFGEKNRRIVYNPNAVLFHYEMKSRTKGEYPGESTYFRKKWGDLIFSDPFYSPHLTLRANNFSLKEHDE
jgi:O-antigen biosynthesis protein